ncbi:MAG: hypothetical protein AB1468_06065, partial [Candidatus Micrarchaeota archaeon]
LGVKKREEKTEEGAGAQEKMVRQVKTVKDVTVLGKVSGAVLKGAKFVGKMALWQFKAPFKAIKKFGEWWGEFSRSKAGRAILGFLGIITLGMAGRRDYGGTSIKVGPVTFYAGSQDYIEKIAGMMDAQAMMMWQNKKVAKQIGEAYGVGENEVYITIASGWAGVAGFGKAVDVLSEKCEIAADKLVSEKASEGRGENAKEVMLYKDKDGNVYVRGADGAVFEVKNDGKGNATRDSEGNFERVSKPLMIYETGKEHGLVLLRPTGEIRAYQEKESKSFVRAFTSALSFFDTVVGSALTPLRYGMMSRRIYDTSGGMIVGTAEPEDQIVFRAMDEIEGSKRSVAEYEETIKNLTEKLSSGLRDEVKGILENESLTAQEKMNALEEQFLTLQKKEISPERKGKIILKKILTGEGSREEAKKEDIARLAEIIRNYGWGTEAALGIERGLMELEMINGVSVARARLREGENEINEAKEKLDDAGKFFGLPAPDVSEVLYDGKLGEYRKKITEKSEALKKGATAKESKKVDEKTGEIMQKLDEYSGAVRRNYVDNEFQTGVALGLVYVASKEIEDINQKIKKEKNEDRKDDLKKERERLENLLDFVYDFKPMGERTARIPALFKSVLEGKGGGDMLMFEVAQYKKGVYSVEDAYYEGARLGAVESARNGDFDEIDRLIEMAKSAG